MNKKNKSSIAFGFLLVLFTTVFVACKKEVSDEVIPKTDNISSFVKAQTSFAKLLALAIKSDADLRNFIKQESLKQFDKDYDVLYQIVKDTEINNGETLRSKLLKFTTVNTLDSIESELPLLTIYVPDLPNFNAEKWNSLTEVPLVAVANQDKANSVSLFGDEEIKLQPTEIPGFPVIVIKNNERIQVKTKINSVASINNYISAGSRKLSNLSFEFIDKAFDGSIPSAQNTSIRLNKLASIDGSISRTTPSPGSGLINSIDQINIDAYNSGVEWHRDFVYYGLTPNNSTGKLKNNYSEFITSFKFLNSNALGIIADQDGDPKPINTLWRGINSTSWTEGNFEIRITILINAKNGLGNELTKMMSVNPRDLFELKYQKLLGGLKYNLIGVTPKEYNPNIELLPWDLENYGTAWKFIFYEIDNAQEVINSFENTTTYATNFEISGTFSEKTKIGFKFGASATFVEKKTFSVKTTLTSDFLGEATLTFDQPIITGASGGNYITREITTGNLLSISVEPKRVF